MNWGVKGRELDLEVATRVMGYEKWSWDHARLRGRFWMVFEPGLADTFFQNLGDVRPAMTVDGEKPTEAAMKHVPTFSTDLNSAWTVADRMKEAGLEVTVTDLDERWQVIVKREGELLSSVSSSAAEAICEAAVGSVDKGMWDPNLL